MLGVVLSGLALTAPGRIYGWLGIASGVLLLGIGFSLFRQARRRSAQPPSEQRLVELVDARVGQHEAPDHRTDHEHGHGHGHGHGHEHERHLGVTHAHGWGGAHTHPAPATSARSMIAVGFAGGMVPSPSALIVLLGGIALGRAWFGVLLVVGYGIGMALALIGVGLTLAHARDRLQRWAERRRRTDQSSRLLWMTQTLPSITAVLVMIVGLGLAVRSLIAL